MSAYRFVTIVAAVAQMALASQGIGGEPNVRADVTAEQLAWIKTVTAPATRFAMPEPGEDLPGGATTSPRVPDRNAFSQPSANLDADGMARFKLGSAMFRRAWSVAQIGDPLSGGLGPLFNARSCESCHVNNGRGHPEERENDATSLLFALARAPASPAEHQMLADKTVMTLPDPVYGHQLQEFAVPDVAPEGSMAIAYKEMPVLLGDGTVVHLRKPIYTVSGLAYGPLDKSTVLSPRLAPPMIGLGLAEFIHPADIMALADPDDGDGDGISGKPNRVRDPGTGEIGIGRFGWKATIATVREQTAAAFGNDIGVSTPDRPANHGDCTPAQEACRQASLASNAAKGEAPEHEFSLTAFYAQHLAVPMRRDMGEASVLAGKALFYQLGCASCHVPKFVTRRDAPDPDLAFQLIWPYSDFLLHDMGVGLADWMIAGVARGTDWRTPPLWGLGLGEMVNGHSFYLHDGRARNLTEAILWHGGEGKAARDRFALLAQSDRDNLMRFLHSL